MNVSPTLKDFTAKPKICLLLNGFTLSSNDQWYVSLPKIVLIIIFFGVVEFGLSKSISLKSIFNIYWTCSLSVWHIYWHFKRSLRERYLATPLKILMRSNWL